MDIGMKDKEKLNFDIRLAGFWDLLQISFIVLKLCKVINWSWWLVLLPIEIEIGIILLLIIILIIIQIVN